MKKIFAIALAVVMVLSIASVAGALWEKPASEAVTNDNFGYSIDVIKFTRSTGGLGSSYFNADDAATAVNGADVYYAIKLVVDNPSDAVKANAKADVSFTAIQDATGKAGIKLKGLGNGVYYFGEIGRELGFYTIDNFVANSLKMNATAETPVFAARCLDTATAKVSAKVYSERPLDAKPGNGTADSPFTWNGYTVEYYEDYNYKDSGIDYIRFTKGGNWIQFEINADGVAKRYQDSGNFAGTSFEWDLYSALSIDPAMLSAGSVYMTKTNLRSAFGFAYSQSDSVTWNANSTPIILDPIGIPKTGDNASVIGFAMIMVAVVAAAVAVRKVNA